MPATGEKRQHFGASAPVAQLADTQGEPKTSDDPQTEIIALCRQAESLAILMEAGADNNDPENTDIRDTAFERVCAIGDEIVQHHSAGPADILGKIRLWRLLALEDALDPERSAPDERLLLSIIDDIENHLRAL